MLNITQYVLTNKMFYVEQWCTITISVVIVHQYDLFKQVSRRPVDKGEYGSL